jgi:signal transduction histidine kinase
LPDDTNKVNLLIKLSSDENTPDTNFNYANRAYKLSIQLNYKSGIVRALNSLALNYYYSADYERAFYFFQEQLKKLQDPNDFNDIHTEAECLRMIGEVLRASKDYDFSLEYLKRAEDIFKSIKDSYGLAKTYNRFAAVYLEKYIYSIEIRVTDYIEKSNQIAINKGYYEIVANNFNILATYYASQKDFDKAIEIFKKTIDYFKNDEKFSEKPNVLRNLASTYSQIGIRDSALFYARMAYYSSKKNNVSIYIYESTYQLFNIFYNHFQNLDSAMFYIIESNTYKDKIYDEEKNRAQIQSQIKFESKLKDQQISKQKELNIYQITVFIIILLLMTAIILVIINKSKLQKKSNEAIKIQNDKLEELNISKDKFFSIIAHDLKNPIGALRNLSGMLESDYEYLSEDEKRDFIRILSESSNTVLELLENLLTWSRSQRNKIEFSPNFNDFNQIVSAVVNISKIQAEYKKIQIINEIPPRTIAYYDDNMIYAVLRNLVSNSIKFSNSNSSIFIKCLNVKNGNDKFLQVSVVDEGIGMSEEVVKELFSLTTKSSTTGTSGEKGTGLGLILVKEFITKNKGKIWVESQIKKGTTFHFTIPETIN